MIPSFYISPTQSPGCLNGSHEGVHLPKANHLSGWPVPEWWGPGSQDPSGHGVSPCNCLGLIFPKNLWGLKGTVLEAEAPRVESSLSFWLGGAWDIRRGKQKQEEKDAAFRVAPVSLCPRLTLLGRTGVEPWPKHVYGRTHHLAASWP